MGDFTVVTNNRPRLLLTWDELTPKEQREFDYLEGEARYDTDFVRYRGWVYDLGEFERSGESLPAWEGVQANSYFSGILVRYCEGDRDRVVMGRWYE